MENIRKEIESIKDKLNNPNMVTALKVNMQRRLEMLEAKLSGSSEVKKPAPAPKKDEIKEVFYIDFLNKDKKHQKDRKFFETYEEAEKWGKKEFEKYHPDMVHSIYPKYKINETVEITWGEEYGKTGKVENVWWKAPYGDGTGFYYYVSGASKNIGEENISPKGSLEKENKPTPAPKKATTKVNIDKSEKLIVSIAHTQGWEKRMTDKISEYYFGSTITLKWNGEDQSYSVFNLKGLISGVRVVHRGARYVFLESKSKGTSPKEELKVGTIPKKPSNADMERAFGKEFMESKDKGTLKEYSETPPEPKFKVGDTVTIVKTDKPHLKKDIGRDVKVHKIDYDVKWFPKVWSYSLDVGKDLYPFAHDNEIELSTKSAPEKTPAPVKKSSVAQKKIKLESGVELYVSSAIDQNNKTTYGGHLSIADYIVKGFTYNYNTESEVIKRATKYLTEIKSVGKIIDRGSRIDSRYIVIWNDGQEQKIATNERRIAVFFVNILERIIAKNKPAPAPVKKSSIAQKKATVKKPALKEALKDQLTHWKTVLKNINHPTNSRYVKANVEKVISELEQQISTAKKRPSVAQKKATVKKPTPAPKKLSKPSDKSDRINAIKKKFADETKGRTDRAIGQDLQRKAKKAGKRISEDGNVYYEYRPNKSDSDGRSKI